MNAMSPLACIDEFKRIFVALVLSLGCAIFTVAQTQAQAQTQTQAANLKIVTLSPHLAELVSELGLREQIVAVSSHTNFPEVLKNRPVIADAISINLEKLKSIQPDYILIWRSGTPENHKTSIQKLFAKTTTQIIESDANTLDQIASELEMLGQKLNRTSMANTRAKELREQIQQIKTENQNKKVLKVFYQAWSNPLITIHRKHLIGDMVKTCGGSLIFDDQKMLTGIVSKEQVLAHNPDVILTAIDGEKNPADWSPWRRFPKLSATQLEGFLAIEGDLLTRPSPRALIATRKLCAFFDVIRDKKKTIAG